MQARNCCAPRVTQTPGLVLGEMGVEVREEVVIRQVSETRSGIWHNIVLSWVEGEFGAVAMMALVLALSLAEVCCGSAGGGRSLVHAGQGRSVVGASADGAFSYIQVLADDVEMHEAGGLLQVAVGDGAVEILGGYQVTVDGGRELVAPHSGPLTSGEEDPAHAIAGGVSGPNDAEVVGYDLPQPGGPLMKSFDEAAVASEMAAEVPGDAYAVVVWSLQR